MPDSPEYTLPPELAPQEKVWDLESDKWDNEKIAAFASSIATELLSKFSDFSEEERTKKIEEFANAIRTSDETGQTHHSVTNGKGLRIGFGKFEGLDIGGNADYGNLTIIGSLTHSKDGKLMGPEGEVSDPFYITGEPSIGIGYTPEPSEAIEESLQRIKEFQLAVVELNTDPNFRMSMGARHSHPVPGLQREVVDGDIATFKPTAHNKINKGRGNVKFITHYYPLPERH